MKKVLSLLMALVMVFSAVQCLTVVSFAAFDESGIFQYDYENGTVVITGISDEAEGTVTVPSEIDGDTVTAIGYGAFSECVGMTKAVIPSTVKVIGDYAFQDCTGLTEVELNGTKEIGFRAFENCGNLRQITIPKTVTSASSSFYHSGLETIAFESGMTVVPDGVCADATNLKSATIPQGITAIGDESFADCSSLEAIIVPEGVLSIGYGTFSGCSSLLGISFPSSLISAGDYAFQDCRKLATVDFSNVQELGFRAFENCVKLKQASLPATLKETSRPFYNSGLETVTFADGIIVIPDSVCAEAKALKNVSLPDTVTTIGDHAFESCISLEAIEVPEGVTSIGYEAFCDCTSLTSFAFPTTLITVADYAFKNCSELATVDFSNVQELGFRAFENCMKLKTVVLPETLNETSRPFYNSGLETVTFADGMTVIPDSVCAEAKALKNVSLPDTVTAIGDHAFESCISLEAIEVPEGVASIGYEAFCDCTSLTSFAFPTTLITVADYAFKNCSELATVDFSNVQELGFRAFENCMKLKTVVLPETLNETSRPFYNSGLETVTFEDGTQAIPSYAFAQAELLKNVTLPQSVTEIGSHAFEDCENMEETVLPQGLMIIGAYAFDGCAKLKKINIPDTVIGIQSNSFNGCDQLAQVTVVKNTTGWKYFENKAVSLTEIPCSHPYNEGAMQQDATCTEGGYTYGLYCPYCEIWVEGHDVIPATGHIASQPVIENEAAATCTDGGSYDSVVYCSVCQAEISRTKVDTDKLGHSFTNYVPDGNASCTEDGTKTAKCDRCDETDTIADAGSAHGHIPAEAVKENEVKATCTKEGSYDSVVYCSVCNAGLSREKVSTAKTAHKAVIDKAVAATCTKTGLTEGKHCSACGKVLVEQKTVAKKSHTVKDSVTKATTSKDGKVVSACSVCKQTFKTTVVPKVSSITLSATKYLYDGKTKTPKVTVKDRKGKTLAKNTDYTVKLPSASKNTGKYTVTVTLIGKYSGTKTLSFYILPGKTSKIAVSQTKNTIKATWKSVTGASGYLVTLCDKDGYAIKKTYTTKTTYTFSKLTAGGTYHIKVTAYKTIGQKRVCSTVSASVKTATKPGAPKLQAVAGKGKASLYATDPYASGYEFYMKSGNSYKRIATQKSNYGSYEETGFYFDGASAGYVDGVFVTVDSNTESYVKTGLKKGTTYYFKVRAYKLIDGKKIYGDFSSVKSVKVK